MKSTFLAPRLILSLTLCLSPIACSDSRGVGNNTGLFGTDNGAAMSPGIRAVRIGEGGPAFNACANIGRVVNLSASGETDLAVRAAPFVEADEVTRLTNDRRIYVCTRSIDQRWQGVVVPPADAPDADCGVLAPVGSPRNYAGPCTSGWVSSAFVRLTAS
ncbi:hypothetical protein ACVWZA_002556 [Sphingomonas sp. UYAg733]